jgi:predicted nuclease of predicted toxin-antitoxin system
VIFWIDAQLPPLLAAWLSEQFHVEAFSLRESGLRDASDAAIFQAAKQPGIVLISKDSDFVELGSRYGPPTQLTWVTCGNVTNRQLQVVFNKTFTASQELLAAGQVIVEISQSPALSHL